MYRKLEVYAEVRNFGASVALWITDEHAKGSGTVAVAAPVTFVSAGEDDPHEPTVEVSMHAARALMDQLWRAGVRPNKVENAEGELAATVRHLRDMRTLVFKLPPSELDGRGR